MTSASVEGTLASVEGVPARVEGTSARAVITLADAADFSAAKEVIFRHDFFRRAAPGNVIKTSGGQSKTKFVARNAEIVMCNTEIGSCNAEIMVCNDRFRPRNQHEVHRRDFCHADGAGGGHLAHCRHALVARADSRQGGLCHGEKRRNP